MGPGLALVDATLDGDAEQVWLLRDVFGNRDLTVSASEVTRRVVGSTGAFDSELLIELDAVHLEGWGSYDDIVVRHRDRLGRLSPAIHIARACNAEVSVGTCAR